MHRLLGCLAVFLLSCVAYAGDKQGAQSAAAGDQTAGESTANQSATDQSTADQPTKEKPAKKAAKKKDPDEIGNRDVSNGVNFYSIEKEIALGKQLAQDVERQAKIVDDRSSPST
jgi:hypothetical protein